MAGLEPTTSSLPRKYTTTVLHQHVWGESGNRTLSNCFTDSCAATTLLTPLFGAPGEIRTPDSFVRSEVL